MALISILIGLGLEYYYGALDHLRNYAWFDRYFNWLEFKCGEYTLWNGPAGVLFTLAIPLAILLLTAYFLGLISFILMYIFAIAVFIYSLGTSVSGLLEQYILAIKEDDDVKIQEIEHKIGIESGADTESLLKHFLVGAHNQIFAIIFWFIILGMLGALLYSLVMRLKKKFSDVHGGYGNAVNALYLILMWVPARLMILGFALGGSLIHALEGWTEADGHSLDISAEIIGSSGVAAIQYQTSDDKESKLENLEEIKDLLNRTLIIWLTFLGLMTLSGWLT